MAVPAIDAVHHDRRFRSMLRIARSTLSSFAVALTVLISVPLEAKRRPTLRHSRTTDRSSSAGFRPAPATGPWRPHPHRAVLRDGEAEWASSAQEEFRQFVDAARHRPRFPDGSDADQGRRSVAGRRQRHHQGAIVRSHSARSLRQLQQEQSEAFSVIREIYMEQFEQESVLRIDDPYIVWASF